MAVIPISEAARTWRIARSTLQHTLQEGRLSATVRADGSRGIDTAELLNHAFSYHYLKRRSWPSRPELIDHIEAAWPEYNHLYAHPFQWTWTNPKMRRWFAKHASDQA